MTSNIPDNIIGITMNTQRLTVTLPKTLYEMVFQQIPSGGVSRFVAAAVERELLIERPDPVDEFLFLRKKLPKVDQKTILQAIKKGRK